MTDDKTHAQPVWRDRSDFIIGYELPEPGLTEQLWARQIGDDRFEIYCIPFFAYDLALGDVVLTDAEHTVLEVQHASGRFVFRAWLRESTDPTSVVDALTEIGVLLESFSPRLLSIDAVDIDQAEAVAALLARQEAAGILTYDTGATR